MWPAHTMSQLMVCKSFQSWSSYLSFLLWYKLCTNKHHEWKLCTCRKSLHVHCLIIEKLPGPSGPRNQRINYYQWVELFILIQAVLFVAPRIFWRFLCHDIGSQIDVNVRTLQKLAQNMTPDRSVQETREQVMEALVHNTDRLAYHYMKNCFWWYVIVKNNHCYILSPILTNLVTANNILLKFVWRFADVMGANPLYYCSQKRSM